MNKIELINFLNDQDWLDLIKKLTAYVHFKIYYNKKWIRGFKRLIEGYKPEDIVYETIADVYFGVRNWNRDRYPVLLDFLKSVIDSKVSNLIRSYSQTHQIIINEEGNELKNAVLDERDSIDQIISDEFLSEVYKAIEGDNELEEILVLILDELPNRDIAKELDVETKEVVNRKKRLKKVLLKLLEKE